MAGKKQAQNLTPEQRLSQALVPEKEWPYPLPENWRWVRLGEIAEIISKGTTPTGGKNAYVETGINFLRVENIREDGSISHEGIMKVTEEQHSTVLKRSLLKERDVLVSIAGTLGRIGIVNKSDLPMNTNQAVAFIRFMDNQKINQMYIKNMLASPFIQSKLLSQTKVTSIPNLTLGVIGDCIVPLPPLSEQERIVNKIESLFTKLDEAKEKAEAVVNGFENRKAAILHQAFSGHLTEKWRQEHGVKKESWREKKIGELCVVNPSKIDTKGLPDEIEVSFYPMASVSDLYGEVVEPKTRKLKEVRKGFTNFVEGDVVFAKITPCMENGKSAIIKKLVNDIGYGTTEFYVLRCNEKLFNRYLYHLVRSRVFRERAKAVMVGAVGQQRVPKSFLEEYKISIPSFEEQIEIVRLLDDFLAKEERAKELAENVIEQIELMKKSILARAFRGELGTNQPEEENAEEMLSKGWK